MSYCWYEPGRGKLMAGGIAGVGSAVAVVAQMVMLSSRVVSGGDRMVQALHAAPRAVLVWTFPQVCAGVEAAGQISR